MKYLQILSAIIVLLSSTLAFSKTLTVLCHGMQGTRVDYFTQNLAHYTNNKFIAAPEKMEANQVLTWNMNRNIATLIFPDTKHPAAEANTTKIHLLSKGSEQITFTAILSGAPILVSLYPYEKIMVYSMHSVWPQPVATGVRAVLFYAKCNFSEN